MQTLRTFQCSHKPVLVLLSYLISVLGSYCSLQCVHQFPQARGRRLAGWLAAAAVAMGGGAVWSMHFIAMLACRLPVAVAYDPALTFVSLLVAVAVTGSGLYIVGRDPARLVPLLAGGVFTGIGIAAMHYIGMAAMRLPARIAYKPELVVASFLIAIAAAILALWVAFRLRRPLARFGSAFVMAGAVCGMHYAGMTAAVFLPNARPVAVSRPGLGADELGFTVFGLTLSVLALVLMESRVVDARRVAAALRDSEQRYRTAFKSGQSLAARLRTVREEESARIARQVHDEVGQALTALRLHLAWLEKRLAPSRLLAADAELAAELRSMGQLLDTALDAVQRIMTELRPAILDKLGLEAAIDWYVGEFEKRTGISCQLQSTLNGAVLDPDRSTVLFRILQEAFTNVTRHAGATEVDIGLRLEANRVVLDVVDDGRGIPQDKIGDPQSLGLLGMRERARSLGGDVHVRRNPDRGTSVEAVIPL